MFVVRYVFAGRRSVCVVCCVFVGCGSLFGVCLLSLFRFVVCCVLCVVCCLCFVCLLFVVCWLLVVRRALRDVCGLFVVRGVVFGVWCLLVGCHVLADVCVCVWCMALVWLFALCC